MVQQARFVFCTYQGVLVLCSKPVKRAELLARIKAHLRVKTDATWVQSIVKGVLTEDSEAMKILESILPESIIARIQVGAERLPQGYSRKSLMAHASSSFHIRSCRHIPYKSCLKFIHIRSYRQSAVSGFTGWASGLWKTPTMTLH